MDGLALAAWRPKTAQTVISSSTAIQPCPMSGLSAAAAVMVTRWDRRSESSWRARFATMNLRIRFLRWRDFVARGADRIEPSTDVMSAHRAQLDLLVPFSDRRKQTERNDARDEAYEQERMEERVRLRPCERDDAGDKRQRTDRDQ